MRTHLPALLLVGGLLLTACGGAADADVADAPVAAPADDATTDEPADDAATDEPTEGSDPTDAPAEPATGDDEVPAEGGDPTDVGDDAQLEPLPAGDCSATDVDPAETSLGTAEGMPTEVSALAAFLLDAALRCDEQLLFTATEESSTFRSIIDGDPDDDHVARWANLELAGEMPYRRLADVLGTTPALADGGEMWVWPAVTTGRQETRTPELLAELDFVDDGYRQAVEAGEPYLGWRVGISTDGEWSFFIIGD